MKRYYMLLFAALVSAVSLKGQSIEVYSAVMESPSAFLQHNLLGDGVAIFNVKFQGSRGPIERNQIGTFSSNGYTGFQMNSGIVMTTGRIDVVKGPNNSQGMTIAEYFPYVDSVLDGTTCSTLDFYFVAMSDTISFNYCFASEEYPEYVGTGFNDVFAFYVTGPDPESGEEVTRNIAVVPGSVTQDNPLGTEVCINNVNHRTNSQYYHAVDWMNPYIQFDGHTTKLVAGAKVLPCALYSMHISVCNVSDAAYDSGVFLEQGSMKSYNTALATVYNGLERLSMECPRKVTLDLDHFGLEGTSVSVSFDGDVVEGVDFVCTTAEGIVVQSGVPFEVLAEAPYFYIVPQPNADLVNKRLDMTVGMSVCSNFPTLMSKDVVHFMFGPTDPVSVRDTMFEGAHLVQKMAVRLESGVADFEWFPKDGLSSPYSNETYCNVSRTSDFICVATDRYGCNVDTAHVHVQINDPLAVEDVVALPDVKLYPNPSRKVVYMESEGLYRIELFSLDGRLQEVKDGISGKGVLDVSSLTSGVYAVRVYVGKGCSLHKIVVK